MKGEGGTKRKRRRIAAKVGDDGDYLAEEKSRKGRKMTRREQRDNYKRRGLDLFVRGEEFWRSGGNKRTLRQGGCAPRELEREGG